MLRIKYIVHSVLILCFVAAGVLSTVEGIRIHAKAVLAQVLLQKAWADTKRGTDKARPWPWADTWPIARLTSVDHDQDLIVLAGATGRTLAFGPAHLLSSARPGQVGNTVVIGHRDSHFRFLKRLRIGDLLHLESADGVTYRYRVGEMAVVHESETGVMAHGTTEKLTLITCYPFDAILPGGPLRYVVEALPDNNVNHSHRKLQEKPVVVQPKEQTTVYSADKLESATAS
jgi:sortase A